MSAEQLKCDEDDKKKIQAQFIPYKKEPTNCPSSLSSENEPEPDNANISIPVFKHKRLQRRGGKDVCSECTMDFQTKGELCNHYASHTNITFKCNVCSDVYKSEQSYRNHCVKHYKDPVVCPECHKVFPLKSSLSNHMRVHTGVKDVCSKGDCGKSFSSRGKYLEHMQYAHLDKKPYNATCAVISSKHHQTSVITCPVFITSFPGGLSPRNKT